MSGEKDYLFTFLSRSKLCLKKYKDVKNKRPKSDVWDQFGFISLNCEIQELIGDRFVFDILKVGENMIIDGYAACFGCQQVYQYSSRKGTSTLGNHNCPNRQDPTQSSRITDEIQGEKFSVDQQTFDTLTPADKASLHSALIEFVVTKIRPFSIVEDESFRHLLQQFVDTAVRCGRFDVKNGLCSTKTLTKMIEDKASTTLAQIKFAIQTCSGVGLTSDFEEDGITGKVYISLTAHFFDGNQLKQFVLTSKQFPEKKKTVEHITKWFEGRVKELIGPEIDYILVTDSNKNFVSTLKKKEKRISCIAHSINLAIKHVFSVIEVDAKEYERRKNKQIFETSDEGKEDELDYESRRSDENLQAAEICAKILSESQRISTYMSHTKPKELHHNWNSQLNMFRSIAEQFDLISDIVPIPFSIHQLNALIDFFTPFETATLNLSLSQEPTLHLVIPWLVKFDKLCERSCDDIQIVSYLKKVMIEAINLKIMSNLNRIHFAATLLDQRFKKNDFVFDKTKYFNCTISTTDGKKFLKEKYDKLQSNSDEDTAIDEIDFFTGLYHKEPTQDDEWNSYFCENNYHKSYFVQNLGESVPSFKAFSFWNSYQARYPRLCKLAFWFFAVPATCVSFEKNFSEWMIDCRRANLTSDDVNNSLVVKSYLKCMPN